MAQCGLWHRMEKKIISSQNGESDIYDETSEARMSCKEDKCAHCPQETETGGRCEVQSETEFFEGGQLTPQSKKKIRSELVVTTDEMEQCDVRASVTFLEQGNKKKIGFEILGKALTF